ncbi:hypothetical protein PVAND_014745 [Polypedilum vanderplanki]|uniref:Globin domain-containing protein n=1 Tax=Polypedilum vanderplanki TaxID=319348 RepID=A0A9J6BAL9_POLVA|nr:hypothetical protein PVAND_014745 [Polypedilum vanderplanki]
MKFLIVLALIAAVSADLKPLSKEQADEVRHAWDKVKHNEVEILHEIFKAHPDIQNNSHNSLERTLNKSRICCQLLRLASTKWDKTIKKRGVTKEQFNEFRSTLTDYVKHHSSLDGDAEHAWNQAIDNIFFIIFSNLDGHPVV